MIKTYTFKIKVDYDKVVVACHMQLEQFFDSVKMSAMESLVERYPNAYITACDYEWEDKDKNKYFCIGDYSISTLKDLINSKDLKSYLLSASFNGFVGDNDFSYEFSDKIIESASDFIKAKNEILEKGEEENVGIDTPEKE